MMPDKTPTAHLIAQNSFHDPAFVIGNRAGLVRIRDAITAALDTGSGATSVYAHDGEGYGVHVLCVADMAGVPYGYTDADIHGESGEWTEAMMRSVRDAG